MTEDKNRWNKQHLHPWDYLENGKFVHKIQSWTEEFLRAGSKDILSFFESQIIE